jgi:hypothetical protein
MSRITNIDKWLQANQYWRREHNIAHARYQLARANCVPDEKSQFGAQTRAFWQLILERLEG